MSLCGAQCLPDFSRDSRTVLEKEGASHQVRECPGAGGWLQVRPTFPHTSSAGEGTVPNPPSPLDGLTMGRWGDDGLPISSKTQEDSNEANGSGGSTWRWEGKADSTADLLRTLSHPSNSSFASSARSVPGIIVSPSAGSDVQSSGSPVRLVPVRPPFPGEDIGDQKGKIRPPSRGGEWG